MRCIADRIGLSAGVVSGDPVGAHGDGQVPVRSRVTVSGMPIAEYCREMSLPWDEAMRAAIAERTRKMGAAIIQAKGRTHCGRTTCVCDLADAILNRRSMIASVTSPLMGEHGVRGVSLSVPSVVGPTGVQQRIREKWELEEYRGFLNAVEKVRSILANDNIT